MNDCKSPQPIDKELGRDSGRSPSNPVPGLFRRHTAQIRTTEMRTLDLNWDGVYCNMNLFWWILVFGLFTMLLGGGLMAVLLTCTMDRNFRLVVRMRKREREVYRGVPEFEAEVSGGVDHGVPLEMRRV
jgi:hypothetical protein